VLPPLVRSSSQSSRRRSLRKLGNFASELVHRTQIITALNESRIFRPACARECRRDSSTVIEPRSSRIRAITNLYSPISDVLSRDNASANLRASPMGMVSVDKHSRGLICNKQAGLKKHRRRVEAPKRTSVTIPRGRINFSVPQEIRGMDGNVWRDRYVSNRVILTRTFTH